MSSTLRFDDRDSRDRSPPFLSNRDIKDERKLSSSASSSINAASTHHLPSRSMGVNASASSVSENVNNASAGVPLGPKDGGNDRGRLFPGSRTECRDFRDAPPLTEGRSWRDRDRDRDRDREWDRDRDRELDRERERDRERLRDREAFRDRERERERERDLDRDRERDRDSRIRDQPPYREIDRRDRRPTPPPLRRSPIRDFRDSKPYTPRDLEIPRIRKAAGDIGPLSATDTSYADTPTKEPGDYTRDRDWDRDSDFGRPLGRSDWDYRGNRGRGRDSYPDDRDSFRPRSRSRGPRGPPRDDLYSRGGLGRGPDRRGTDTRGGGIGDRWVGRRGEEEKRFERDDFRDRAQDRDIERDRDRDRDRDRERDRDRDRERDFDRYKRDPHHHPPPSRFGARIPSAGSDTKQSISSTRPSSPHHPHHPHHYPPSHYDRHVVSVDVSSKDYIISRRSSAAQLSPQLPKSEFRRDTDKSDYFASRAEASRDRYASNPSSPPVPAPQVPAFGSVQLPNSYPNVRKAPRQDEKQVGTPLKSSPTHQSALASSKPSLSSSSVLPASKDQNLPHAPTAPRAERQASERTENIEKKAQDADPHIKDAIKAHRMPPTGPSSLSSTINDNSSSGTNRMTPSSGPTGRARPSPLRPRTSPRSPVAAPVGYPAGKSQSPVSVSGAGIGSGIGGSGHDNVYNATNIPLGPKASAFGVHKPSSSAGNSLLGTGIPTGPKAERVASHAPHVPYTAPRGPSASIGSGAGVTPPSAPRAAAMHNHGHGSGPRNLTWRAPSYSMRNTIIPTKRDVNGDERDKEKAISSPTRARPSSSSESISRSQTDKKLRGDASNVKSFNSFSDTENVRKAEDRPFSRQYQDASIKAEDDEDIIAAATTTNDGLHIADTPQQDGDSKILPEAIPASTQMEIDSEVIENDDDSDEDDDDDDDGLDLTEEDMVDNEEKFKRTIERLESTIVDLSSRHFRAFSPLQKIVQLKHLTQSGLPEDAYFQAHSQSQSQNYSRGQSQKRQKQISSVGDSQHSNTPRSPRPYDIIGPDSQIAKKQQHGNAKTGFGKMLTPKEEELDEEDYPFGAVKSKGVPYSQQRAVQNRQITPDISSLPYLIEDGRPLTPLSELEAFQDRGEGQERATDALTAALIRLQSARSAREDELVAEFKTSYTEWRRYTMELDKERARREKAERGRKEKSSEPKQAGSSIGMGANMGSVTDGAASGILGSGVSGLGVSAAGGSAQQQPTLSITEGRRAHKFSSEYELELALKESMELEQKAQAEREREEKKAKPDMEREAVIPVMLEDNEIEIRQFHDTNQHKDPADGTRVYDFLPPVDDFTAEEHKVLVQNYKEFPKKWGKIAQALTNRTYKECIKHYYATKWNKEYKPPRDKRRQKGGGGGGGGRGKGAKGSAGGQARGKSNALISDLGVRPDVYEGDEINLPLVAVTDSGRPRRAAAPTFGDKDAGDVEQQQQQQGLAGQGTANGNNNRRTTGAAAAGAFTASINPLSTSGAGVGRMDGAAETVTDKQSKKQQRSAVKQSGQRRGKNQSLAATPAPSPSKQDREKASASSKLIEVGQQLQQQQQQLKQVETTKINANANAFNSEETKMYSTFQADQPGTVARDLQPQQMQRVPRGPTPGEEVPMQIAPGGTLVDRPKVQANQQQQQRAGPSSYWSVPEQMDFIKLVNYYGKDWNAIAARMGTKTATMVSLAFASSKVVHEI